MGATASGVAWTGSNGAGGDGGVGVGSAGGVVVVTLFSLGDETILGDFIVVFFFRHHLRSLPLWSLQH